MRHGSSDRPLQKDVPVVARHRHVDDRRTVIHRVVREGRVGILSHAEVTAAVIAGHVALPGQARSVREDRRRGSDAVSVGADDRGHRRAVGPRERAGRHRARRLVRDGCARQLGGFRVNLAVDDRDSDAFTRQAGGV